jgi:hypothetical protein
MPASDASLIPAPQIVHGDALPSKWQREYQAFEQLLPQLLQTHRGQYVLIHEGQVAASGDDDLALALQFFKKHGNVPVHVGLVAEPPRSIVRIPHYREAQRRGGVG